MSWLPKQRVVVPVDFSGDSTQALRTALEMVNDRADLHAIHVLVPLDVVSPGVVWGMVDEPSREAAARRFFEKFLQDHQLEGVTVVLRTGDPGGEIADYADEIKSQLIVIPSHGYHGVKRFLLGSVAERVIRQARCPVLVLRRADAD